jgi:hypothetical protein
LNVSPPSSLPAGPDPAPVILLFLAGIAVLMLGRLISSRTVTAAGVAMVFAATIVVPAAYFLFLR